MKRLVRISSVILAALALVGCGPSDEDLKREVTLDEAKTTLSNVVAATASADIPILSDKFGSSATMVEQHLAQAGGWAARPKDPPTVVDSYIIPAKRLSRRSYANGGRVLVLEGTTGLGQPYRSEFLVSWSITSQKLIVQYPIYWLQMRIGELNEGGTATTAQR